MPVGGTTPIKVDLRVVSATHRSLDALAAAGSFRCDLFARLSGFTFQLPPLRKRREDIGLLIAALVDGRRVRFTPPAGATRLTKIDVNGIGEPTGGSAIFPGARNVQAIVGMPLTPVSYAGVARRTTRRAVY